VAIYRSLPATWATITGKFGISFPQPATSTQSTLGGLYLGDSTGKALLYAKRFANGSLNGQLQLNPCSALGVTSGATFAQLLNDLTPVFYLQMAFVSSTSINFYYSVDGVSWVLIANANPSFLAVPPTRVGFYGDPLTATTFGLIPVSCAWLRVR
jgi:hypothetical protein